MYRLAPQQQEIVEKVAALADQSIAPHAARIDHEALFPREGIQALAQAGFLGLTIPQEYGGMGQGLRVAAAVVEQIARRCASTAMVYVMHLCGIASYMGNPATAADALHAAAQGRHLSTLAWSEQGSRSQFWLPTSRETPRDGVIELNADKSFVTSAGFADGYVVTTQASTGDPPLNVMLYLVYRDDPGVTVAGEWRALGMRGTASAPMSLRGVKVGAHRQLCQPGKGLDVMLGMVLPVFHLGIAAVSVGIAEAAVQITQRHLTATRFEHQGSRLADLSNLRARLAQMRMETDRARAHLVSVIDAVESPGPDTQLLVLEAKTAAAEAAVQVTHLGMRTCGGAAFSGKVGLDRLFRDAQAAVVMAPTTDHAYEFIGRALCGMEVLA